MTKKELLVILESVSDNTELRFFHDGMLLPISTVNDLRKDSGWENTVALSGVVPVKYKDRFETSK